jgi:hypothetical protein
LREFSHDQRLDVGARGFLIVQIRPDISDVRVGQADNLSRVAGVGEDFLIAGETGIENNLAAATRASAGRAPVKEASVLERENRGP